MGFKRGIGILGTELRGAEETSINENSSASRMNVQMSN